VGRDAIRCDLPLKRNTWQGWGETNDLRPTWPVDFWHQMHKKQATV